MSNTPWRRVTVELEVDSGVTHSESASVPNTPGSAKGTYWVRSDSPTVPMYTDSDGTDFVLTEGTGSPYVTQGIFSHGVVAFVDFNNSKSWEPGQATSNFVDIIGEVTGTAALQVITDGRLDMGDSGALSSVAMGAIPTISANAFANTDGGAYIFWVKLRSAGGGGAARLYESGGLSIRLEAAVDGYAKLRVERFWTGTNYSTISNGGTEQGRFVPVNDSEWVMITVSRVADLDNTTTICYINDQVIGMSAGAATGTAVDDTGLDYFLMNSSVGGPNQIDGLFERFAVLNYQPLAAEVAEIWRLTKTELEAESPAPVRAQQPGIMLTDAEFHIDFNNSDSFVPNQPAAGPTWDDLVYGREGAIGLVAITDGHANFNGTSSNVNYGTIGTGAARQGETPSFLSDGMQNPFGPKFAATGGSVNAWIRVETAISTDYILDTGPGGAGFEFRVLGEAGGLYQFQFKHEADGAGTDKFITTNVAFPIGSWVNIGLTWNGVFSGGSVHQWYWNGQPISGVASPAVAGDLADGTVVRVGSNHGGGGNFFDGDIEMLTVWSEQQGSAVHLDIFNATAPRFGFSAGTPTWEDTLSAGNFSGVNDAVMSLGRAIRGIDTTAGSGGTLTARGGDDSSTGTGGAGIFRAGDSDSGTAGALIVRAGNITTTGAGGAATVSGGASVGNFDGGDLNLFGGVGGGVNKGGDVFVTAGAAGVTSALNPAGGGVTITGGASTAAGGVAGAVLIRGGVPVDGDGGGAIINGRDGVGTNRQGGAVLMGTGDGTGSGNSGIFQLTVGNGGPTGSGGLLSLTAGNSGITSGNGGDAFLTAGDGADSGGEVFITAGTSSGGGVGRTNIQLAVGAAPGSTPTDADEILRLSNAGTNGGTSDVYLTDRTPVGFIFANPGSLAIRESAATSALYVHNGAVASNSDWVSATGSPTFEDVLSAGDFSGVNDAIISIGRFLRAGDTNAGGAPSLLAIRGGNNASALTTALGGAVTITGGSTNGVSPAVAGNVTIAAGPAIGTTSHGGALFLNGGTSVGGRGGDVTLAGADGFGTDGGGDVNITAGGPVGGGQCEGGNVILTAGNSQGSPGVAGKIALTAGSNVADSGNGGAVEIIAGPGWTNGGDVTIKSGDKFVGTNNVADETGSILIETGAIPGGGNFSIGDITLRCVGSPSNRIAYKAGSVLIEASDAGLNGSVNGGAVTLTAGASNGSGTAKGGDFSATAGNQTASGGDRGGNMTFTGGAVTHASNGNDGGGIALKPGTAAGAGSTGALQLSYANIPVADGTAGQVLTTAGGGTQGTPSQMSWVAGSSGGALTGSPGNIYEDLQFYVDPADRNSFPATGGTGATDLEGNGTAGTLSAAAVFDNGAWTFNGASGDDVRFTKGATLDNLFAGGGTIITILRPYSSGQGTLGRAIDTTESTTTTGYYLSAADELTGHVRIQFNRNWTTTAGTWATDNITDAFGVSDRPLRLGDWAVVAVSYDDSLTPPVVYLDGTVLAVTETSTPSVDGGSDAGNDVYIGNRSTGLFTWNGQIGTTLMFDRILTADEVQQVTNTFYARRGVGIRGYDSPSGVDPISGQTINIVAGDGIQADGTSDGGDVLIQAGDQTSASGGTAGEVIIRSGDQTTGTSFGDRGSRVLIESGASANGSGVTLRVGVQDTGGESGDVLIHSGDNDGSGSIGAVLIRGGAPSGLQSTRLGGSVTVRGGDAGENGSTNNHGGTATFRGGEGIGNIGNGGATTVRGGDSAGNAGGGDLILRSGTSGTFQGGNVSLIASGITGAFGDGGSITVQASDTIGVGNNSPGGGITIATGSTQANSVGVTAGNILVATGGAIEGGAATAAGGGSFIFTGGTSAKTATSSPGGEFLVTAGAGTANSTNSRGGAVSLTGGAVTGASAATAGGVTLTGGAATVGTGGTISLQPGAGPVVGSLILDYSTWPALDGTGGFVLSTDGAGALSWIAAGAGGSATAGQEGILYNGNTFYVDAGDRNSYPGTGTEFTDLINSTLGTMSGIGVIGGHFNFDGGTDVINFGVVVAAETEDIFDGGGTISFWVRPKSDGGTNVGRIIDTTGGTSTNGYFLRVDSESGTTVHLTFQAGHATTAGVWTVNAALQVGQWSHVVVTYSDNATTNDPTFYVNTLIDPVDTETTPVGVYGSDTGNTLFMGNSTATTEGWNGDIDVAIFLDRAISADEVQQLYRVQQSRFRPSLLGPRLSSGLTNAVGTDIEISGADGVGTGEGSDISISTGAGGTTGTGGEFAVQCGSGGSVSGQGGFLLMVAGHAGAVGASPGTALFQGGNGLFAGNAGGASTLQGGFGFGGGGGGTAKIQGGTPGISGAGGAVQVLAVAGGATSGAGGSIIGSAGGVPSATAANAGNITFTAGSATNGGGSGDGGSVSLQPGVAAGSGADGSLILDYSTWPAAEGTSGQSLQTDGAGALSWASAVANSTAWSEETAITADATVDVTIATPIAVVTDGTQHSVEVLITAESGGANTYFRRQVFTYYRDGGGAVQWTQEINGAEARRGLTTATASLAVSGNAVLVEATGEPATTINWTVQYRTTNTIQNGGTVSTTGIVRELFDNRSSATTTGNAVENGGAPADFTIAAGAAYVTMQMLRVVTATGTCANATIQFFYDAARTAVIGEIYDAQNKDTSTQFTDRTPATMMGNDGSGLESNIMYGRITNNDAGDATFNVECVLWGVT